MEVDGPGGRTPPLRPGHRSVRPSGLQPGLQRSLPGERTATARVAARAPAARARGARARGARARGARARGAPAFTAALAATGGALIGPQLAVGPAREWVAALLPWVSLLLAVRCALRPAPRATWWLMLAALACASATRAAAAWPRSDLGAGAPRVGVVRGVRASSNSPSREAWRLGGHPGLLVPSAGALLEGDLAAVAPTARRAARARSTHRPLSPRTSSLRPRADEVVRQPGPEPGPGGWIGELRARCQRACAAHPDPTCAALLSALMLGDRSRLDRAVVDRFTRTGTRHLLALSGFHVGLVTALVILPVTGALAALLRLGLALAGCRGRPTAAPLAAASVLLFIPLTGGGAPATRAALGLALALLAPWARRRPSALNLLGAAALMEVAADPLAPLSAGTQLSYLATLALVTTAAPAHRALSGDPTRRPWLADVGSTGWPRPPILVAAAERFRRLLWAALAAGGVASLATLPVVWAIFGEWSPASLLATPAATPAVAVLLAGGWLRALVPCASLDAIVGLAADLLLRVLATFDALPWTPLPLPERPPLALAAAAAAPLLAARIGSPIRARRLASGGALGFGLLLAPWPGPALASGGPGPIPRGLEVHVLDVGNGTAVVVRAPGAPSWVVDAGSRDRLAVDTEGVGALLRALDVGRLRVAVSHAHADHAGAVPWITERWGPPGDGARREACGRHRRGVTWWTDGLSDDGGLAVAAIGAGYDDPNEGSAVFDLRWTDAEGVPLARVVLCGDAEGDGLRALLEGGGELPWLAPGPVDLLLLPHHGSSTRHLAALLERLAPRLAVVSGRVPRYAAELSRRGIPLHVTGRDGPLLWRTEGRGGPTLGPPWPEAEPPAAEPPAAEATAGEAADDPPPGRQDPGRAPPAVAPRSGSSHRRVTSQALAPIPR